MGDFYGNAVRHPEDVGNGNIRRTVALADLTNPANLANGVPIGTLEAGAIPTNCRVTIVTAFNAGTTNNLDIGSAAVVGGIAGNAAVAAGTAGYKNALTPGPMQGFPLPSDTQFFAKFSQSGAAATTGIAIVIIDFVNRREVTGIPFPNNP